MGKASWRPSLVALALLVALLAAAMVSAAAEEGSAAPAVVEADAPAPAPASEEPSPGNKTTIGAKAKAGLHTMMKGISAGKNKLECKVLGRHCPDEPSSAP